MLKWWVRKSLTRKGYMIYLWVKKEVSKQHVYLTECLCLKSVHVYVCLCLRRKNIWNNIDQNVIVISVLWITNDFHFFLYTLPILFFLDALHGMWGLSSLTRDWTHTPALEAQSLNHWTAREVSILLLFQKKEQNYLCAMHRKESYCH